MILLLDGDIFVYRYGFAANDSPFPICRSRFEEGLMDLLMFDFPESSDYRGFLTEGSLNFRDSIAVTAPYKGNRSGNKPVHYDELRQSMVDDYGFEMVEGQEADDAIGIAACELGVNECVIVSLDKDLDMIPGLHYNFVKKIKYSVTSEEAMKNFYRQLLTGDRVDNIIGLYGIGPVKANKILEGAVTEKEMYDRVLAAYDGVESAVLENGQLLWIRRKENELWQPPK